MFSVFKKLKSPKAEDEHNGTPRGLQTMSQSLQKKFSKGVQYNMKIVIKGDRNVGKTCLFHRLRGQPFLDNYIPTDEIQVTSIHWNYKATDDVVKVEVWDVVDKGKKRVLTDNLKIEQTTMQQQPLTTALDAEFIDVYKGTNGVILVMDITKTWTFEYVQRELNKIPDTVPVLILGNHCDMAHHRSVTGDQVSFYCESLNRFAPTRYADSSMYNGFGLKFLHKWFNVPFLQLQRETLLAQINTNEYEMNVTVQELDLFQQSDDSNYEKFTDKLSTYRRKLADSKSTIPSSSIVVQTQNVHQTAVRKVDDDTNIVVNRSAISETTASQISAPSSLEIKNKIYGRGREIVPERPKPTSTQIAVSNKLDVSLRNIEEFIPDDNLDRSFLEDSPTAANSANVAASSRKNDDRHNSDSDGESNDNPLVSQLQDDIDITDELLPQYISSLKIESEQQSRDNNNVRHDDDDDKSKLSHRRSIYGENWPDVTTDIRPSPDGGEDDNYGSSIDIGSDKSDQIITTDVAKSESGQIVTSLKRDKTRKSKKDQQQGDDVRKKDKKKKKCTKKEKQQQGAANIDDELEDFLNSPSTPDAASYYEAL